MKLLIGSLITVLVLATGTATALDVGATIDEAESLLAAGDSTGALQAANRAVEAAPMNSEAFHCRFRVFMARAQDEEAFADIGRAIALAPGNAKYLTARAELHAARGETDRALKDLAAAIAADEAYATAYRTRAHVLLTAHSPEEARADAERAVQYAPDDARARMILGDVFEALANATQARAAYVKATELAPRNRAAWLRLGRHELRMTCDPAEAIKALDHAVTLEQSEVPNPTRAEALSLRAEAKLELGKADDAEADAERAMQADPTAATPYGIRATVRRGCADYAGAMADVRRGLTLDPDDTLCRACLHQLVHEDGERLLDEAERLLNARQYDAAEQCVRQALEIDPTSEACHEALRLIEAHRRAHQE